ncbi:MAG: Lrp/AsnC ligand binding domain-containing protein [Spirochaetes bacterium]|nr:Lrp/AsnC ligand binding domain-containing protein [Spirochaetota bacterium]
MVSILSFMVVRVGATESVTEALRAIPQVSDVYSITGKYDLAVRLEGRTSEEIFGIFTDSIEKIEGIVVFESHLIMQHWARGSAPVR